MRKHIVITGTGRAGTTFLVQLLDCLGFDTGIKTKKLRYNFDTKCGLEYDIRQNNAPYICKDPRFCEYAGEVFARPDIVIEYIIVPIRDLYEAAESRRHVNKMFGNVSGTLWDTDEPGSQEDILLKKVYNLMFNASQVNVPIILVNYPMLVQNHRYLYKKLRPLFLQYDVSFDAFCRAFNKIVHPEWVHNFRNG